MIRKKDSTNIDLSCCKFGSMNREAGKKDRYVTASAAIYSIETDCSFLSASYLINNIGQEYGLTYNFTDVDTNTGTNMYNQDWDIEF